MLGNMARGGIALIQPSPCYRCYPRWALLSRHFRRVSNPERSSLTYQPDSEISADFRPQSRRLAIRLPLLAAAILMLILSTGGQAEARPSLHKAIWGPATPEAFNRYSQLGVGIYQMSISWASVAPTRPANARNPKDPAYNWLDELDTAIRLARKEKIRVAVNLTFAPRWANGNRQRRWAPNRPGDFGNFVAAAVKRYPYVRYWMIWSEPSRRANFLPLARVASKRQLTRKEQTGPRTYARILDASYGAVKSVNRNDFVIGGGTIPGGSIRPLRFIQAMRLPNGRPPRMDLYGHNAYSPRLPNLSRRPAAFGTADLSDFDSLAKWLDRYLGRTGRNNRLKIFVSEYSLPTSRNEVIPFWGNRQDQARYAKAALRLVRNFGRAYSLGWFQLYDQPPQANNLHADWGLLDWRGNPKPAFRAFRRG